MNLADSMKKVLKNNSQNIFTDFWKEDLKTILKDIGRDVAQMAKSGAGTFRGIKTNGIKITAKEMLESASDTLLIFKILPKRVYQGFADFKEALVQELDSQPDQKQKTIFSLKVIGALTSFTLGAVYSIRRGKTEFFFSGLKRRNVMTQFIVAEVVFKLSQVFILRFLTELEKEVTNPEDLKSIRYFKDLISARSMVEAVQNGEAFVEADKAIEIVENLKRFIMTGKKI
jgi:hypothetical protein